MDLGQDTLNRSSVVCQAPTCSILYNQLHVLYCQRLDFIATEPEACRFSSLSQPVDDAGRKAPTPRTSLPGYAMPVLCQGSWQLTLSMDALRKLSSSRRASAREQELMTTDVSVESSSSFKSSKSRNWITQGCLPTPCYHPHQPGWVLWAPWFPPAA